MSPVHMVVMLSRNLTTYLPAPLLLLLSDLTLDDDILIATQQQP